MRTPASCAIALLWLTGCTDPAPDPAKVVNPAPVATPTAPPTPDGPTTPPAAVEGVVQGLDLEERRSLFRTPTGAEMIPESWLRALVDSKTGKPFLENLERFGFIPDPTNPDGLPIGLTVTPSKAFNGIKVVGANCAACHVGEITRDGRSTVVIGAPNLLDFNQFVVDLNESVKATLTPEKLVDFLAEVGRQSGPEMEQKARALAGELSKLLGSARSELSGKEQDVAEKVRGTLGRALEVIRSDDQAPIGQRIETLSDRLKARLGGDLESVASGIEAGAERAKVDLAEIKADLQEGMPQLLAYAELLKSLAAHHKQLGKIHEHMDPIPGPGRIDAFGAIRDIVLLDDANFVKPDAPVSYPHLWPVDRIVYFHWDGNTNSWMQRDVGQTIGLGAIFKLDDYFSTVLPTNLFEMERLYWKASAPEWPSDMFGPIDRAAADRGRTVYEAHCIACHKLPAEGEVAGPPPFPAMASDRAVRVPLDEIKTDPKRTMNVQQKVVSPDGSLPEQFTKTLGVVARRFTEKAFEVNEVSEADAKAWDRPQDEIEWPSIVGYVARPLDGIWATAPYLHNGSVPTLHDLLLPPDQRPKTFVVGSREYDPAKLGFLSEPGKVPEPGPGRLPLFEFDATKPGNLNTGHDYGKELKAPERADLLEFLKTL